ncbi:hypothetical protein JX266_014400, partial [Neoarthrinium moseri]
DVAREQARDAAERQRGIIISTSSSQRNNLVGIGFALRDRDQDDSEPSAYLATIATPLEQNPFIAELQAMAMALRAAATQDRPRQITVVSSNKAALLAVAQPRQRSGQEWLLDIYETTKRLKARGHTVYIIWSPAGIGWPQQRTAKGAAKLATKPHQHPDPSARRAKSTTFNKAVISTVQRKCLPPRVGKYSKDLDTALPGRHTRKLYDGLKRADANILAQLRTGMARLNSYLFKIGATDIETCPCGHASETIKHFLFRCSLWTQHRTALFEQTDERQGDLSFFLGGKSRSDPDKWTPNLAAVKATIAYAKATGRLQWEQ